MSLGNRVTHPVAPLRHAFERSGMSKGQLADRLGWHRPNIDRVNRVLGYRPHSDSRGVRRRPHLRIAHETAERIAEVLGLDPFEWEAD